MTSVGRIRAYIDSQAIKKSEFYLKTGLSNGYLDKVKELGADKIESIIKAYPDLNLLWIITGQGKMLTPENGKSPLAIHLKQPFDNGNSVKAPPLKGEFVTENVTPTVTPPAKKHAKTYDLSGSAGSKVEEGSPVYNLGMPRVVVVNERKEDNIVYVPVKARAGYLNGYGDPEFMSALPTLRLPGLNNGTYRMFEVEGPSMAPNIMSGDRVIGQWVNSLNEIRENRVHIIVCKDGVVIKRILNRMDQRGKIVLKSDTINHRKEYPTYDIDPSEILEIWYCRLKLSADFAEPAEVYHRLNDLEAEMTDLRAENKQTTASIDQLWNRLNAIAP